MSIINDLKKELLLTSEKITIIDDTITITDDSNQKTILKINPKTPIPNPLFEQHFYNDNNHYHIVQLFPI